jgi:hypothetical protein
MKEAKRKGVDNMNAVPQTLISSCEMETIKLIKTKVFSVFKTHLLYH